MGTVNVTLGEDARLNLILGQQLENAVTSVVFDFSAWQTAYGSGTLALSVQRPGDDQPYAVTMTTSGTDATWSVTNLDTAYKGVGHIQLTYTVGSAIKKSVIYKFTVYESLGANGEYPSPGQTWQEEIEDELADVKQDLQALIDGGTGLSQYQKDLFIEILRAALYSSDQSDNIDALEDSFAVQYTDLVLSSSAVSLSSIGGSIQLTATTTPAGGLVTWTSSDTSVVTVSNNGLVTSTGYGSATITASIGGLVATCSVVVAQATLIGINAVYTQSGTVTTQNTLSDLTNDLVVTASWDNGTTSIVSSDDYTLSGTLSVGTSTITVSYGGYTDTFNVTVTRATIYSLGETVLTNASDSGIDTGITQGDLFTIDGSTLLIDFEDTNNTNTGDARVFWCNRATSNYQGVNMTSQVGRTRYSFSSPRNGSDNILVDATPNTGQRIKVAMRIQRFDGDSTASIICDYTVNGTRKQQIVASSEYIVGDATLQFPLTVGYGSAGTHWGGTIHSMTIYSSLLTDEEVTAFLS